MGTFIASLSQVIPLLPMPRIMSMVTRMPLLKRWRRGLCGVPLTIMNSRMFLQNLAFPMSKVDDYSIATNESTPKFWTLANGSADTQVGLRPKLFYFYLKFSRSLLRPERLIISTNCGKSSLTGPCTQFSTLPIPNLLVWRGLRPWDLSALSPLLKMCALLFFKTLSFCYLY